MFAQGDLSTANYLLKVQEGHWIRTLRVCKE